MEFFTQFWEAFQGIVATSGFYDVIVNFLSTGWQNLIMLGVACFLLYLAIKKQFEPLLLLPIAFGMLLVNLCPGIMAAPDTSPASATSRVKVSSLCV